MKSTTSNSTTPNITRYDRNLSNNLSDFEQYKEDKNIIKNIAIYLAYSFQHCLITQDLFGRIILDPKRFAEIMHYKDYRFLLKKHENPVHLSALKEKKSPEDIKLIREGKYVRNGQVEMLWDSILDNALYKMYSSPIIFTQGGKTPNGYQTSELKQLRFFEYLKKFKHPTSGKIYYEFELSPTFINNLARYFFNVDTEVFAKLRKKRLQDVYIKLAAYIQNNKNNPDNSGNLIIDAIDFNNLKNIMDVKCTTFSNNKIKINSAIKDINEAFGYNFIQLTWAKSGKYLAKPIIQVFYNTEEYDQQEPYSRLKHYLVFNLKTYFSKQHSNKPIELNKWLTNSEKDTNEKLRIIQETHIQCFSADINTDNLWKTYHTIPLLAKELMP